MVRPVSSSLQNRIDKWFERDYRETFMERIRLIFEAEKLFAEEGNAVRYGHTMAHVLAHVTPVTGDGPIAGEFPLQIPSPEEEKEILEHYKGWWDIPTEERREKILFYYSEGWIKCRPPFFPSFGHLALDWESILDNGIGAWKKKAEDRLAGEVNADQKQFLEGALICYDALTCYMERLAAQAEKEGKTRVASNLRAVSAGPAETFEQALQLIWILVLVLQKVCGCGVLNLSRMDQYLLSRFEKDLAEGTMTEDDAVMLLQEFYYRNNEIMVQTDHMSQEIETTKYTLEVAYDDPNYLILAGKLPGEKPGVNRLSFLMIEAARAMRLRNPFIVVRYYNGIDEDFWTYCCDGVRENTSIVFYNDETMIPALKSYGIEEPEVYDYGFFGCNDPIIPADTGGLRQVWFSHVRPIELALNCGDYPMQPLGKAAVEAAGPLSPLDEECQFDIDDRMTGLMTGAYYGVRTKAPEEMTCMDDVIEAYRQQTEYLIGEFRRGFEIDFAEEQKVTKDKIRIEDCFLRGTIENALTWTEGGTKYSSIITQGCGLATAIDTLYAIDQICFVKKEMTVAQLAELLAKDYAGNERQALLWKNKLAKFGNDNEAVDRYGKVVTDIFLDAVRKYNGEKYVYQMWPTYSTDRDFTTMGKDVGATADGRRAGEQLSENQSPTNGADTSGLTAMLNSLSRIPFKGITGGPLNIRLHPTAVAGEDGLKVMSSLLRTYMEKGGMQMQINVVDATTLRDAQQNPDRYKTLCVRVTGYSAFFVEMGRKAQDELIARTEHQTA